MRRNPVRFIRPRTFAPSFVLALFSYIFHTRTLNSRSYFLNLHHQFDVLPASKNSINFIFKNTNACRPGGWRARLCSSLTTVVQSRIQSTEFSPQRPTKPADSPENSNNSCLVFPNIHTFSKWPTTSFGGSVHFYAQQAAQTCELQLV